MKNCLIALLAMAFLWPAFAFADSYCVSFPTSGESKWTKRDNTIQVRFKYSYPEDRGPKGLGPNEFLLDKNNRRGTPYPGSAPDSEGRYVTTGGVLKGRNNSDNILQRDRAYESYPYGARDLCVYNPMPSPIMDLDIKHVRLDVKWGGDCGQVAIKDGRFTGTHEFEIYHRKGDLVNPFGCRRK